MNCTIESYDPRKRSEWDAFVASSRNATFLFMRDYMDYHADRFADRSLMARDGAGRLVGLLPASGHEGGAELRSHGGLTYGGWLLPPHKVDAADMLDIWGAMAARLRADGVRRLVYKPVPHIYHASPAEEDLYALFRAGARLDSRMVSSALSLREPPPMGHSAADNVRLARRAGLVCGRSERWDEFWDILADVLASRHGAVPVHSPVEIESLRRAFPDRIVLHAVETADGRLLGGTVIYDTGRVAHTQYIAASPEGRRSGALAWLFRHVIDEYRAMGRAEWLDFGTSCERGGEYLNEGLLAQKSSYGARAVVYDSWTVDFTGA